MSNVPIETHYRVLFVHSALWKDSKFRIVTTLTNRQKTRLLFSSIRFPQTHLPRISLSQRPGGCHHFLPVALFRVLTVAQLSCPEVFNHGPTPFTASSFNSPHLYTATYGTPSPVPAGTARQRRDPHVRRPHCPGPPHPRPTTGSSWCLLNWPAASHFLPLHLPLCLLEMSAYLPCKGQTSILFSSD